MHEISAAAQVVAGYQQRRAWPSKRAERQLWAGSLAPPGFSNHDRETLAECAANFLEQRSALADPDLVVRLERQLRVAVARVPFRETLDKLVWQREGREVHTLAR